MTFTRRWLILFALGAVPLLFAGVASVFLAATYLWYGVLIILALADGLLLPPNETLEVERLAPERLSLGVTSEIRVRVKNAGAMPIELELRETPPEGIAHDLPESPFRFTVASGSRHAAVYHVTPSERGDFAFGDLYLRVQGRLGMVQRTVQKPLAQPVRVYPNLAEIAKFALMARKGRLQQAGIRAARLQGAGREFESLRDYLPDDEMRRIDWKASARQGKLVARQYEVERSQNLMLVVDAGRTMLAEIDGVQKIEYAINAALLLAYVATQTEDKVGLLVFSDRVQTYLPPKKGTGAGVCDPRSPLQCQGNSLRTGLCGSNGVLAGAVAEAVFGSDVYGCVGSGGVAGIADGACGIAAVASGGGGDLAGHKNSCERQSRR